MSWHIPCIVGLEHLTRNMNFISIFQSRWERKKRVYMHVHVHECINHSVPYDTVTHHNWKHISCTEMTGCLIDYIHIKNIFPVFKCWQDRARFEFERSALSRNCWFGMTWQNTSITYLAISWKLPFMWVSNDNDLCGFVHP